MKSVDLPSDSVLVLVVAARPSGPHVDININTEWWEAAGKDHRKAVFMAGLEALGRLGNRVIPEEFSEEATRPLDPLPPDLADDAKGSKP